MLIESHIKENLSRSHVQAIAAMAGVNIEIGARGHDYGIDGTFHQIMHIGEKRADSGISIDFQLKSSTKCRIDDDSVIYDLEASTYNNLAFRGAMPRATPTILILLVLPKNQDDWITLSEKELTLRHCCYWEIIPPKQTENSRSVVLKISRDNILTPECLNKMLENIAQTGKIK